MNKKLKIHIKIIIITCLILNSLYLSAQTDARSSDNSSQVQSSSINYNDVNDLANRSYREVTENTNYDFMFYGFKAGTGTGGNSIGFRFIYAEEVKKFTKHQLGVIIDFEWFAVRDFEVNYYDCLALTAMFVWKVDFLMWSMGMYGSVKLKTAGSLDNYYHTHEDDRINAFDFGFASSLDFTFGKKIKYFFGFDCKFSSKSVAIMAHFGVGLAPIDGSVKIKREKLSKDYLKSNFIFLGIKGAVDIFTDKYHNYSGYELGVRFAYFHHTGLPVKLGGIADIIYERRSDSPTSPDKIDYLKLNLALAVKHKTFYIGFGVNGSLLVKVEDNIFSQLKESELNFLITFGWFVKSSVKFFIGFDVYGFRDRLGGNINIGFGI